MSERKIIDVRFGCEETERDEYSVTMTSSCMFKDESHNLIENVIDITVDKEDNAICFYNEQTDSLIILHPEQVNHLKTILSEMDSGELWKTEMERSGITWNSEGESK